jgi:hypothetical protein
MTTLFNSEIGQFWTNQPGLTAQGVGREYLPTVLWSETSLYSVQDNMVNRMLQCITNTFPTCFRLHIMHKSEDRQCKFCSEGKLNTLYHWQCECTRFHDALTEVHNNIWSEVLKAICSHLSKHTRGVWHGPKRT